MGQPEASGVAAAAPSIDKPPTGSAVTASGWRVLGLRSLHLLVLAAMTIAAPLFLAADAQFFIGRGATGTDMIVIALAVLLAVPLALSALELVAYLASRRLAAALHLVFVGCLAALFAAQLLRALDLGPSLHIVAAALAGTALALAYARARPARSFVTALSPAPVVLLAFFVFASGSSRLLFASEDGADVVDAKSRVPVVMVVFDEFPGYALLDRRGRINSRRYPSFARLAGDATFYPNATTSRSDTEIAVPTLISGRDAPLDSLPTAADHPKTVFTLLGASHDVHASEPWTDLCPEKLCPDTSAKSSADRVMPILSTLPWVLAHVWVPEADRLGIPRPRESGAPNRNVQVESFIERIERTRKPQLHYLHVLLPHKPWRYLPSGRRYPDAVGRDPWLGGFERWGDNSWETRQFFQRFMLQVGHVDRLIGRLIDRLEETGLYDRAMIVVTADHGVSFRHDQPRRDATTENVADIASVPLLVKYPGEDGGRVDRRPARTVDVLPTIEEVTGVQADWPTDGVSLLDRPPARRSIVIENKTGGTVRLTTEEYLQARDAALRRQHRVFGERWRDLYEIGPRRKLLGHRVEPLSAAPLDASARIVDGLDLRRYTTSSTTTPSRIGGELEGIEAGRQLAVALHGRVVATTRSYDADGRVEFAAMLPPRLIETGDNRPQILAIERAFGTVRLRPLEVLWG